MSARRRFLLCAFVLLVAGAITISVMHRRYYTRLQTTSDVFSALVAFLEQNDGRFPANRAEFEAAPFWERSAKGLRLQSPSNSTFVGKVYGATISADTLEIRYAADLTKLVISRDRLLSKSTGEEVLLFRSSFGDDSSREYSVALKRIADEIATTRHDRG